MSARELSRHLRILLAAIVPLLFHAQGATAAEILFVAPDGEPQEQLFRAFDAGLRSHGIAASRLRPDAIASTGRERPPSLVVAAGVEALRHVLADDTLRDAPVLSVLAPRESFQSLLADAQNERRVSGLWLDQPLETQIALIRRHLPEIRHLGILHGEAGPSFPPEEITAMQSRSAPRLTLRRTGGERDLLDDLSRLAVEVDAILAIPDARIYGRDNIVRIMLTTYRHGVPIIGYAEGHIRAGALMAAFSTPQEVGGEAAATVLRMLDGQESLPVRRHMTTYSVRINRQVARALGVAVRE